MSSVIILGGMNAPPPDQGIIVETRTRTRIANVQDKTLPYDKIMQSAATVEKYVQGTTVLINGASGYYNCMGLVFGSRRTQICELDSVWSILEDDGYSEIPDEMLAKVGDVAIYVRGPKCEHVGLVVAEAKLPYHASPRILSKLGYSIEIVHDAHASPYNDCERRYYRVRNYDVPEPQ